MIKYYTAGESHGKGLVGIIEGIPYGIPITSNYINRQLSKRQQGYGRSGRMALEHDQVNIISGVRHGKTIGSPIAMILNNAIYEKDKSPWHKIMSITEISPDENVDPIQIPRPGHADLVGSQKYHLKDIRSVIERSSARETAMKVCCGAICRRFLEEMNVQIVGHVVSIGDIGYTSWEHTRDSFDKHLLKDINNTQQILDNSSVRCFNDNLSQSMITAIKNARKSGNSIGGVIELVVIGLPPGLGSYMHWERKLDGQLAQAIMATQAMKSVQIGLGWEGKAYLGDKFHDEIVIKENTPQRNTNHAGGIEAGITTGMPLILRAFMKPIPTLIKPLNTININTGKQVQARYERSDVCAVPRAVIVLENAIAPILANTFIEKFGADTLKEIKYAYENYMNQIKCYP